MSERASIFDDGGDFDVSAFAPKQSKAKTETSAEAVRAVAEKSEFRSREPAPAPKKTTAERERRRYTTGRNVQLNIKARSETLDAFYSIADAEKWVLGETLERAVAALQREIGAKPGQGK
jgi:hypothetical protein